MPAAPFKQSVAVCPGHALSWLVQAAAVTIPLHSAHACSTAHFMLFAGLVVKRSARLHLQGREQQAVTWA